MKFTSKFLLLFCITIIAFKYAGATHLRSGVITYSVTGNLQIQVTLTTYTKISGQSIFADQDIVAINWGDGTQDSIGRVNGPVDTIGGYHHLGVLVCPDMQENIYTGLHSYYDIPPPPNNFFVVSFLDDNRIAGINNISDGNSVDVPLYIEDTIWFWDINKQDLDNSPIFLDPPCDYANVNDTFTFNPVAYDMNGDSMAFALKVPLEGPGSNVPLYQFPDEYCNALGGDPSGGACTETINALTGQYTWAVPCVSGFFNIAFLVTTFRCGVELGTVEMDMQFAVFQDLDSPPAISTVNDTVISPGEKVQWQFTAADLVATDSLTLNALSGAFLLPNDTPVFHSIGANPVTGTLTWQPNDSVARQNAYIFSVRAQDNYVYAASPAPLANYSTFRVWVADTAECAAAAAVTRLTGNEAFVSLYPNPSSGNCTLQVSEELVGTKMEILDVAGQVVFMSGVNNPLSEIQLNIAPGIYVLHIYSPEININKKLIHL